LLPANVIEAECLADLNSDDSDEENAGAKVLIVY